jgi:hypothetical protein
MGAWWGFSMQGFCVVKSTSPRDRLTRFFLACSCRKLHGSTLAVEKKNRIHSFRHIFTRATKIAQGYSTVNSRLFRVAQFHRYSEVKIQYVIFPKDKNTREYENWVLASAFKAMEIFQDHEVSTPRDCKSAFDLMMFQTARFQTVGYITKRCRLSFLSPNVGGGGGEGLRNLSQWAQLCTSRDMEPK